MITKDDILMRNNSNYERAMRKLDRQLTKYEWDCMDAIQEEIAPLQMQVTQEVGERFDKEIAELEQALTELQREKEEYEKEKREVVNTHRVKLIYEMEMELDELEDALKPDLQHYETFEDMPESVALTIRKELEKEHYEQHTKYQERDRAYYYYRGDNNAK